MQKQTARILGIRSLRTVQHNSVARPAASGRAAEQIPRPYSHPRQAKEPLACRGPGTRALKKTRARLTGTRDDTWVGYRCSLQRAITRLQLVQQVSQCGIRVQFAAAVIDHPPTFHGQA